MRPSSGRRSGGRLLANKLVATIFTFSPGRSARIKKLIFSYFYFDISPKKHGVTTTIKEGELKTEYQSYNLTLDLSLVFMFFCDASLEET